MRKKIFTPLFCSLAFVSCGKNIENSKTTDDTIILNEASASNVKMELSFNSEGTIEASQYKFGGEAWLKIPEAVFVKTGDLFTFSTRIYFNTTNSITLGNAATLYCDYSAFKQITGSDQPSVDGYNHYFNNCYEDVDGDGEADVLNYLPGDEVPQDIGRFLKIELINSSANSEDTTEVYSDIEVDWR